MAPGKIGPYVDRTMGGGLGGVHAFCFDEAADFAEVACGAAVDELNEGGGWHFLVGVGKKKRCGLKNGRG